MKSKTDPKLPVFLFVAVCPRAFATFVLVHLQASLFFQITHIEFSGMYCLFGKISM
tara:strand:- start:608 stop:775 length:168 start_codon:yes stop_codon:yes gene_type:complete